MHTISVARSKVPRCHLPGQRDILFSFLFDRSSKVCQTPRIISTLEKKNRNTGENGAKIGVKRDELFEESLTQSDRTGLAVAGWALLGAWPGRTSWSRTLDGPHAHARLVYAGEEKGSFFFPDFPLLFFFPSYLYDRRLFFLSFSFLFFFSFFFSSVSVHDSSDNHRP